MSTFALVILLLASGSSSAWAARATKTIEIRVMLFGQPCTLEAPAKSRANMTKEKLTDIHALSPAQIPPFQSQSQAQEAHTRVLAAKSFPEELRNYLTLLEKYTKAAVLFFELIDDFKKNRDSDAFLKSLSVQVPVPDQLEFSQLVRRAKDKDLPSDFFDQVQEAFFQRVVYFPQEEFHRALRLLEIRYQCAFDEPQN